MTFFRCMDIYLVTVFMKLLLFNRELTIRARVTIKSDKHLFANARGPGIMSTMDLVDKTGEIRLTAFGPIVHQIFDLVEVKHYHRVKTLRC